MKNRSWAALALLCLSLPAFATTYYVSNSGSDANAGTSTGAAWQTVAKVNSYATSPGFNPGDSILFADGGTWHEQMTFGNTATAAPFLNSGTSGSPIVIGSYGTGAKPILDEADVLTGTWTLVTGTTYSIPYTGYPTKLFEDGTAAATPAIQPAINYKGNWAANTTYAPYDAVTNQTAGCYNSWFRFNSGGNTGSFSGSNAQWGCLYWAVPTGWQTTGLANVEAHPGYFYANGTTLYVSLADGTSPASHTMEATTRNYGVNLENVNYVTLQGLQIMHASKSGILANQYASAGGTLTGITIQNNTVLNSGDWLIDFIQAQGLTVSGTLAWEGGITVTGFPSSAGGIPAVSVTGNTVTNVDIQDQLNYGAEGIGVFSATNPTINGNTIQTVNAEGIRLASQSSAPCSGGTVSGNDVSNSQAGIRLSGCSTVSAENNKIHDSNGFGFQIGGGSLHTLLAYNLIDNIRGTCGLSGPGTAGTCGGGGTLYNGIDCNGGGDYITIYNNTIWSISGNNITLEKTASPYHGCPYADIENNILDASANVRPDNTTGSGTGVLFFDPDSQPLAVWRNNLTQAYTAQSGEYDWKNPQHGDHWIPFVQFEANLWETSPSTTLGNLDVQASPQFTNVSTAPYTFSLTNGSLACGTGVELSSLGQTSAPNMGEDQTACTASTSATLSSLSMEDYATSATYGFNTLSHYAVTEFTAVGTYSDGSQRSIPRASTAWSSSASTIASFDSIGDVTGKMPGLANLTSTYGGESATWTNFTVTQPADPRANSNVTPLSFYTLSAGHMGDAVSQGLTTDIERTNAGPSWTAMEPCRGQYVFSGNSANLLYGTGNAWVPKSQAIGTQVVYTMYSMPAWADNATDAAATSSCKTGTITVAPYDIYWTGSGTYNSSYATETCEAVGSDTPSGTNGDCLLKEFYTALMQQVCHVTAKPAKPLLGTCDIHYFEGINEYDRGSAWTGNVYSLGQMFEDAQNVIHAYCGDCYFSVGSASCGGLMSFGGTSSGTCGQNVGVVLDAIHSEDSAWQPDLISIHPYTDTDTVYPSPMPESRISGDGTGNGGTAYTESGAGGSSYCTSANSSSTNSHCPVSFISAVASARSAITSRSWITNQSLPIFGTESGPYYNDEEWDTGHTDPLTGNAYTNTLEAAYVMREALVAADFNNPLYGGQGLVFNNWYQFDNTNPACFGDEYLPSTYGSGSTVNCNRSGHVFSNPVGVQAYGTGHKTVTAWLQQVSSFITHCGDVNGVNTGFNEVWSCTATDTDGTKVQFLWDTGWERQIAVNVAYQNYTDWNGVKHAVQNGQVVIGPAPIRLDTAVQQGPFSGWLHGIARKGRRRR